MRGFVTIFTFMLIIFTLIFSILLPSKRRHERTVNDTRILTKNKK